MKSWSRLKKIRQRARALPGALVLFSLVFCLGTQAVYGEEELSSAGSAYGYRGSPVAMEASYGYDNMAKGGRYLPIYVTLTSQTSEDFSGKLEIKSMESDYDIYQYRYPVSLEGGQTQQVNLYVPLGLRTDQMYVILYDEENNLIVQQRLKINVRQDVSELLIGVLSDSQDKLEYLNGVGIQQSTLLTRTCAMVAGSIPAQAAGLDQLDVLLITNYDTRRLSGEQINTIEEWVSRGGVLLLGTGERGQEAVETFLGDALDGEIPDSQVRTVNMGEELAVYGPSDVLLSLDTTQLPITNGRVVLSSNGMPVVTAVNREKGMIAAASFDFSQISDFCQDHPYVDKLFTSLLGEDRIQELSGYLYDGGSSMYWQVQSLINSGAVDKLPNIPLYVIVIAGYILLAGPGLYLFLKHRNLGRYYGGAMTALSLCCGGLVYLMGSETRFQDTFFNYATIRDYSEDTVVESTYLNIRTPDNRSYPVRLDSSYDLRPITRLTAYDSSRFAQFSGEERPNVSISYDLDATRLSLWDVAAFSPNYFRLEKGEENKEGQGFSGKITCFNGEISGSITNNLGHDVERAAVLCSGAMVMIDSIKDGETVTLDDLPVLFYPVGSSYVTADRISGGYQYQTPDIHSDEYMEALRRTNLLNFYLENFLSGYQYEARVVAFGVSQEENGGEFILDEGYETEGLTMYTAAVEAEHKLEGRVSRTSLERSPSRVSGSYNASDNTMDQSAPLTLTYSFGGDMKVDSLSLLYPSEEFTENPKYGSQPVFSGDIYFYNVETGNFDQMEWGKTVFTSWELEPYLDRENTLTVKYVYNTPEDYLPAVALPILSAAGRENHA